MREQEQLIALCEWANPKLRMAAEKKLWHTDETEFILDTWPDTNSLDVLHDFEKKLDYDQQEKYAHELSQVIPQNLNCGPGSDDEIDIMVHREFDLLHATAEQRRMALLKTLNLWREDSNEEGK